MKSQGQSPAEFNDRFPIKSQRNTPLLRSKRSKYRINCSYPRVSWKSEVHYARRQKLPSASLFEIRFNLFTFRVKASDDCRRKEECKNSNQENFLMRIHFLGSNKTSQAAHCIAKNSTAINNGNLCTPVLGYRKKNEPRGARLWSHGLGSSPRAQPMAYLEAGCHVLNCYSVHDGDNFLTQFKQIKSTQVERMWNERIKFFYFVFIYIYTEFRNSSWQCQEMADWQVGFYAISLARLRDLRTRSIIPSNVLWTARNPVACTNTQEGRPITLLNSSSLSPRQDSGKGSL